jgi:hypothetical protein
VIRVIMPAALRRLARIDGDIELPIDSPVTQRAVLDALEARYPALRGTLRDHESKRRRAYVRFFACGEDRSNDSPDDILPDEIASGAEPFIIIGALSGG